MGEHLLSTLESLFCLYFKKNIVYYSNLENKVRKKITRVYHYSYFCVFPPIPHRPPRYLFM